MRSIFCNFALSQNPFFKASYVFEGERKGGRGGREGGEGGKGGWGNGNMTVNKPKIRGELWPDKD